MLQERSYDPDECIRHMGLDPTVVHTTAQDSGKSIVEVISGMLGIEPREFMRLLKEKANLGR